MKNSKVEAWARDAAFVRNSDLPKAYQEEIFTERIRVAKADRPHVLLIGGAGYIGSVVSEDLLRNGYQVTCMDLLLYQNQRCVLPNLLHPAYRFIRGDFASPSDLAAALEGVTDVVVLGGLVGDPICKKYGAEAQAINIGGMQNVLRQVRERALNKVVVISTCSNYGLADGDQLVNETSALNPLSFYARAKVQAEQEFLALKGSVDSTVTVLRFATAFGLSPRMRFDLTLNEFTREMFLGRDLLVFDPDTWRPYCHVRDFATVVRRVLEAPKSKVNFEVFNAGGETGNFTKRMIVEAILPDCPRAKVEYKAHGTDPRNYRVDFSKIRERLYFEPKHHLHEGVQEILRAMRLKLLEDVDLNRNFFGNYELDYISPNSAELCEQNM